MKIIYVLLFIFLQSSFINDLISSERIENENNNLNLINNTNLKDNSYLIGPGDLVFIKFFGAEEFTDTYPVFNDGSINLPIIGQILIENLSIKDASYKIENLLKKELLQPHIYLSIKEQRPLRINISGEIKKPGIYILNNKSDNLTSNANQSYYFPTIVDGVNKAGGFTQNANLKNIEIKRLISGNKKEYKTFSLDLAEILYKKVDNFNLYLNDGDFIKVHKADSFDSKNLIALSTSNLVDNKIKVNVIGEVKKPGELTLNSNTTLTQAVLSAGGLVNLKANKANVKLFRINNNGTAFYKSFKIDFKKNISKKLNPILKNGDIVEVSTNTLALIGDGVDTLIKPILLPFSFFR